MALFVFGWKRRREVVIILLEPLKTEVRVIADKKSYLNDVKKLLKLKWPQNRTINIVCHGHSVPSGYFDTPTVDTFNSYPHLLHKKLKEKYPFAVINVIVSAIGGENCISGSKRFSKDVLKHSPDVVTIDYGLNDRGLPVKMIEKLWSSMIKQAKKTGAKVILLTPTGDKRNNLLNSKDELTLRAEHIRKMAAKYGTGLADSTKIYTKHLKSGGKTGTLMSHVNHPNRKGHKLVATELTNWFGK